MAHISTTAIFIVVILGVLMLMAAWDGAMERRYGLKSHPRPQPGQSGHTDGSPRDSR